MRSLQSFEPEANEPSGNAANAVTEQGIPVSVITSLGEYQILIVLSCEQLTKWPFLKTVKSFTPFNNPLV